MWNWHHQGTAAAAGEEIGTMEEHEACEVECYEFIAGTSDEVTPGLIKATRMPWMASRITAREDAWFIERARCAPWDLVAPDALPRDADAAQPDGQRTARAAGRARRFPGCSRGHRTNSASIQPSRWTIDVGDQQYPVAAHSRRCGQTW
jgi:hypothetical protein